MIKTPTPSASEMENLLKSMPCKNCKNGMTECGTCKGSMHLPPEWEMKLRNLINYAHYHACTFRDEALDDKLLKDGDSLCELIRSLQRESDQLLTNQSCCHCKSKDVGFYTCSSCEDKEDTKYRKMRGERDQFKQDADKMAKALQAMAKGGYAGALLRSRQALFSLNHRYD